VVWVNTEAALQNAVSSIESGRTIVIQKGTYDLSMQLNIGLSHQVTNVTIRGETDDFNDVVLRGKGIDNAFYGNVGMGISVFNAQHVTIANLSIGEVYFHPIELKGEAGASAITVYHVRLFNAGEQFLKAQPKPVGFGVSDSTVAYSLIEYTNGPPNTSHGGPIGYFNAIDVLDGQNWVIESNLIRNMHNPDSHSESLWNPAVLIWYHSANVITEDNTFIDCDKAIAYGLEYRDTGYDNQGGIIRNNFVYQTPGLFSAARVGGSDGQINIFDSPGTAIDHNTILNNGNCNNSIQARRITTGAEIRNNLADTSIGIREGAVFSSSGNYLNATPSMFVDPSAGDLHLVVNSATQAHVIDQVAPLANVTTDWDGEARPQGGNADIGADEVD
jgi:hypothetical protein